MKPPDVSVKHGKHSFTLFIKIERENIVHCASFEHVSFIKLVATSNFYSGAKHKAILVSN